jgi:ornithine decarboxylase
MLQQSYKPIAEINFLKKLRYQTPYFILDNKEIGNSINLYKKSFNNAHIYYAMKANSEVEVLRYIKEQELGFEVASSYELRLLKKINVSPSKIIYGTSVKPIKHIKDFVQYGVDRFAFDSEQELIKLSKHAPGSNVYVRTLVKDAAHSVFTMSEKFGTSPRRAVDLLIKAKELGLIPYGISFNVGSQARNPQAWANGISTLLPCINDLEKKGIKIQMLDLGGGFPQRYLEKDDISSISSIGIYTTNELNKLPKGIEIIIEPGRGIVAHSMALIVSVIAKIKRSNGHWLYLDGGAYNALLEAMEYQGTTRYKVSLLKDYNDSPAEEYILTGPTGDNLDVINKSAILPSTINVGDKLMINDTGAYSTVLTTPFNGFPKPKVHVL